MQDQQLRVEDTNQQALASKISAIKKGYFVDDYAEEFTHFRGKRDIIIHRGYWARVHFFRKIIESMIINGQGVQIVSLGCGLDTLWFNLIHDGKLNTKFRFVELDLEEVVRRKISKIHKSKKINQLFQSLGGKPKISQNKDQLVFGQYYVLDHCDLSSVQSFKSIVQHHELDPNIPTLFYCECVLSYIDADRTDDLMFFINKTFNLAFVLDYQMYNPHDRFGQMMIKNFNQRGCPLIGTSKYPLLQNQKDRYTNANFKRTEVYTMQQIYYDCIDKADRLAVEKLEMLDELQEWNLIMSHYFCLLSLTYNQEGEKNLNFKNLVQNVKLKK